MSNARYWHLDIAPYKSVCEPTFRRRIFLPSPWTTRRYISEGGNIHSYSCENLKCYRRLLFLERVEKQSGGSYRRSRLTYFLDLKSSDVESLLFYPENSGSKFLHNDNDLRDSQASHSLSTKRLEYLHTLPLSEREFSPLHIVQTGSGAHPAFYTMDTWSSFSRSKEAAAWSWPLTFI
jgi:hypothetical protein